ncbi:MAG: peptidoglycan editing factor PgeF, partial [Sphingobium sp.]
MTGKDDMAAGIVKWTSAALGDMPHAFFGRQGGVSTGLYAGLNVGLGSDDDRDAIAENRRRVIDTVLPGAALVSPHQVHSPDVVPVTAPFADDARPHADALVTATPGLLLGIVTADCVPVLFADREAGVVGAAHAGWKGAIAGVTDRTLDAMEALGARRDRIGCAIGPCIARASYEVDQGFVDRFLADDPENERFFAEGTRPGHAQFDIEAYAAARLAAAGVTRIEMLGQDTYAQPELFFSYRRSCHKGEPGYGRQISVIGL